MRYPSVEPLRAAAVAALTCALLAGCGSKAPSASEVLSQGLAAQAKGQFATASADYLSVVSSQPENYVAWYDLGVIAQEDDGDTTGAAHDYSEAIGADANYGPALFNLAVLETSGDARGALNLYERVIKLDPSNAKANYNAGLVMETLGQRAQGKAEIARAIQLDPSLAKKS